MNTVVAGLLGLLFLNHCQNLNSVGLLSCIFTTLHYVMPTCINRNSYAQLFILSFVSFFRKCIRSNHYPRTEFGNSPTISRRHYHHHSQNRYLSIASKIIKSEIKAILGIKINHRWLFDAGLHCFFKQCCRQQQRLWPISSLLNSSLQPREHDQIHFFPLCYLENKFPNN